MPDHENRCGLGRAETTLFWHSSWLGGLRSLAHSMYGEALVAPARPVSASRSAELRPLDKPETKVFVSHWQVSDDAQSVGAHPDQVVCNHQCCTRCNIMGAREGHRSRP